MLAWRLSPCPRKVLCFLFRLAAKYIVVAGKAREALQPAPRSGSAIVKMIAEYLEHAMQFESMAGEAADPKLKESLLGQARA